MQLDQSHPSSFATNMIVKHFFFTQLCTLPYYETTNTHINLFPSSYIQFITSNLKITKKPNILSYFTMCKKINNGLHGHLYRKIP